MRIIRESTIKLERKNTGIREFLETDGYYPLPNSHDSDNSKNFPNIGCIMFFEDGCWVYFHFRKNIPDNEKQKNMSGYLNTWIGNRQIRWGVDWGVYSIKNDTLTVHLYDKPSIANALAIYEIRYKIIDRKTIKRIYFRAKSKTEDKNYITNSPWENGEPMYFKPADSLPPSDCWLKEKKWIWQNESDWKEYMQYIKQKKKEFKKKR